MYTFKNYYISDKMMNAIDRYLNNGIVPGDFLQAVICNDLFSAVGRADEENCRNLPAFVAYFYNEAPLESYGSREKLLEWSKQFHKKEE